MCEVADDELVTREVRDWKGVHLICDAPSACSQKVIAVLVTKGIPWEYKRLDILTRENRLDFFMGVNPRGVIPVLVKDGRVFIESCEIVKYLEDVFPDHTPELYPRTLRPDIDKILEMEDNTHTQRNMFSHAGYLLPVRLGVKQWFSKEQLDAWLKKSPGDVRSAKGVSQSKEEHYAKWDRLYKNNGASPEMLLEAFAQVDKFYTHIERKLGENSFVHGDNLTLSDIAVVIGVNRLTLSGYPFHRKPNILAWYKRMKQIHSLAIIFYSPQPPMRVILFACALQYYRWLKGARAIDIIEPQCTPSRLRRFLPPCAVVGSLALLHRALPNYWFAALLSLISTYLMTIAPPVKSWSTIIWAPHLHEMDLETILRPSEDLIQKLNVPSFLTGRSQSVFGKYS